MLICRRSLIRLGLWTYNDNNKKWIKDRKTSQNETETNTFLRKMILK
jgi:hypothetical protein